MAGERYIEEIPIVSPGFAIAGADFTELCK